MTQLFMLEDGTRFEWQNEVYKLVECSDDYHAVVMNKRGQLEDFNGCANVKALPCE